MPTHAPREKFEINPVRPTIEEQVRRWSATKPDAVAFRAPGHCLTWAELDRAADGCAQRLAAHGVGPGSRIGWLGHNGLSYPVAFLAARRLRAAVAAVNWRSHPDEVHRTLDQVAPSVLLSDESTAEPARSVAASSSLPLLVADSAGRFDSTRSSIDASTGAADSVGDPDSGEVALFWFTSGSTGIPKAVAIGAGRNELAIALPTPFDMSEAAQLLIVPPVFHVAGSMWVQYALSRGATGHFIDDTTAAGLLRALVERGITHALMVPTLLKLVVDELRDAPIRPWALEHVAYGAAPITAELLGDSIRLLDCHFTQVYGLTEAGGVVTYLPPGQHRTSGSHPGRLDSIGRPLPESGVRIQIRHRDTGRPCPRGVCGAMYLRTPTAMLGYWADGAPLGDPTGVDDWIPTGDLARFDDDGYLYLAGRADDMIITGGENVHPGEVEAVIASIPGVAECAVFGVADPLWGQRVVAAIVPVDPARVTPADVIGFCRARLAHYKCPREVRVVRSLPRTATGKIVRGQLG